MGARCMIQNGGSGGILLFGGGLFHIKSRVCWALGRDEGSSRYRCGFVRGRWSSSWKADAVVEQVPNIQRELTSSFGTKLPWEGRGGIVVDSIKGTLVLPYQIAGFSGDTVECLSWSCKLSNGEHGQHLDVCMLHITKWCLPSDSGVWYRPVSGRVSVELWAFVAMKGWGFIQVRTWCRAGTTVVVVINSRCHCRAWLCQTSNFVGESSLRRWEVWQTV
jgi:hypothetical protein